MIKMYILIIGLVEGDGSKFGILESNNRVLINDSIVYKVERSISSIVMGIVGNFMAYDRKR